MRHVSDTYIALFSHFIPCGVWEAVYLFEGLLKNQSEVTVDIVHGDTQGHCCLSSGSRTCSAWSCCRASATGKT
jgi:TnpA family transposase